MPGDGKLELTGQLGDAVSYTHLDVYKRQEGGRHKPFFDGYRPQFYFRTTDVTGVAKLPEGVEMCMPGDHVTISVELITPRCV